MIDLEDQRPIKSRTFSQTVKKKMMQWVLFEDAIAPLKLSQRGHPKDIAIYRGVEDYIFLRFKMIEAADIGANGGMQGLGD